MDVEIECFGAQGRRTLVRLIHQGTGLYQVESLHPDGRMPDQHVHTVYKVAEVEHMGVMVERIATMER